MNEYSHTFSTFLNQLILVVKIVLIVMPYQMSNLAELDPFHEAFTILFFKGKERKKAIKLLISLKYKKRSSTKVKNLGFFFKRDCRSMCTRGRV